MENRTELPLVSVIVPVYKVEALLPKCVDSLLAQTYDRLEIILVDDGSPDRCGEICDAYAAKDSRIKVIHQKNAGLSAARNAALDMASGTYLMFVDSDDWVEPETVEYSCGLLQKYGVPMAYFGNYDVDGATGEETLGMCPEKEEAISAVTFVERMFHWDNVDCAVCDKFFHRELFREIRFPVGVVSEDIAILYKVVLAAGGVAMGDKPCYHYYHRPESISNSEFSDSAFDYAEHTFRIEEDIRKNHPELSRAAAYLKTRAIGWTLQSLEIADEATRKKYAAQYGTYRKLLRRQLPYIWGSDGFTPAQKRDYVLMSLGLYRIPRMIYHWVQHR